MSTKETITSTIQTTWEWLQTPLFNINKHGVSTFDILTIITILVIGMYIASLYKRKIIALENTQTHMSKMSIRIIANVGFYFIILITIMMSLSFSGIDLTSLSLVAGAFSIGIGFGLQAVVSNMAAGIIIMFERSIRIGDFIEINDTLRGTVSDIKIRATTIKTTDNIDVLIPNSTFVQNNVINWTLDDPTRRVHIPFGVAYGTSVESLKTAILTELEKSDLQYIRDNSDKTPEIWMVGMGASSVDFELLVWIDSSKPKNRVPLKSDFLIEIYNALYKHNIEIPFPQLDIHTK